MGVFQYEARNRAGEFFAGTVEARDEREAAGLIRRRGLSGGAASGWLLFIYSARKLRARPQSPAGGSSSRGRSRRRRLPSCACSSCGRWRR